MVATDRAAAGGAAGAGGHGYGARVAAYYAVSILREAAAAPGFELPQSVTLESLRCETPQAVDDLELATSEGGRVLLQIKRRVQASTTERSDLASSTDQFVREFLSVGAPAGGRPFDRRRDRLVLMCGPASSATIVRALPVVLARLRDTPPTRAEEVRRTNAEERRAWGALLTVLRAAWVRHTGEEPPDEKLVELLTAVWVVALEVEAGGRDEQAALERLREGVLVDPGMAALTWRALAERMLGLAGVRSGITRTGLHEFLVATGVRLQVVRSMRGDVARLRERSLATRDRLARYSRLRLGSGNATIERTALVDLAAVVLHSPLLLIGAPGTGKSGLIHALLERFDADGVDCVALAAEDYAVGDLSELRSKLELEHDLTEVLDGWPGDPGVVVIDGLDAARGADGPAAFVELVETLARDGGRWKVLASVRTFDLRHHRELREAVPPAAVPTRFCDAEFVETGHFRVPELSDAELASLASSAPALAAVLGQADHALVNLVRNPFNLNLLAGLAERLRIEELTPIRTQLELLARHWTEWVAEPPQGRHAREGVLEAFCHLATELMRLQVPRSQLLSRSQEAGLLALLGSGVIVEEFPGGALGTERLSLAHHLLFDFIYAQLLLPEEPQALYDWLATHPEAMLLARPSLVLRLQALWDDPAGRADFWHAAALLADGSPGPLARMIAPATAAAQVRTIEDLRPLLDRLESADDDERDRACVVLDEILSAITSAGPDLRPLSILSSQQLRVWAELAEWLSARLFPELESTAGRLLWALWREADAEVERRLDDEDQDDG